MRIEVETVYTTGLGKLPPELTDALLMLETGWTIQELRAQPASTIQDLKLLIHGRALQSRQAAKGS